MKRALSLLLLMPLFSACALATPFTAGAGTSTLRSFGKGRDGAAIVKEYYAPLAKRNPDLIAKKYALMSESAFAFFRGSAHLFYADVSQASALASKLQIPLQGDLHLENMGSYLGADGAVAYDLNDFDEAFVGPYTWELARCAVSILLAADEAGLKPHEAKDLVSRFLQEYRAAFKNLVKHPAALSHPLTADMLRGPAVEAIADSAQVSRADFIDKLTSHGALKLGKKLSACDEETRDQVRAAVGRYATGRSEGARFFTVKDVAARLAGVASIGRYRYVALIEGATDAKEDDVVLELKEEAPSTAVPYAGTRLSDEASRVMQAYRYFLPSPDRFLGAVRMQELSYLVRELQPAKGGVELADLKGFKAYAEHVPDVALVAARAHARSSRAADLLADQGDGSAFDARILDFALSYQEQVKQDHAAFKQQR